ncbi:hypothetical protein D3C71_1756270 [compost metagenome]
MRRSCESSSTKRISIRLSTILDRSGAGALISAPKMSRISQVSITLISRARNSPASARKNAFSRVGSIARRLNAPRLSITTRLLPCAATRSSSRAPTWSSKPSVVGCQHSCKLPPCSIAAKS